MTDKQRESMPENIYEAHAHSTDHRSEIISSLMCGCFCCLHIFKPDLIWEWINTGSEEFAMCPYCGIDSLIGSASGHPITKEFMQEMNKYWFNGDVWPGNLATSDDVILTLDQHIMQPSINIADRADYRTRHAVRAVITDGKAAVPLLHATVRDYYKLPGGGIDDGEDIQTALARELAEEIGAKADINLMLGTVIEWKDSQRLKQISYCFTATLKSNKNEPDFTKEEVEEGFEVVWTPDIDHAIKLVEAGMQSSDGNIAFMTTRDTAILKAAKTHL